MNNKLKLCIADVFRSLAPCFFVIFYVPTLLLLGPQGAPGQRLCVPSALTLTHADLSLTLVMTRTLVMDRSHGQRAFSSVNYFLE